MVAESIETQIYTVTGPAAELSTKPKLPPAVGYVSAISQAPGPVAPVVINGFTTSLQLPTTASIPTGPITIAPVNVVAPSHAIASSGAVAASDVSASLVAASKAAKSAAVQESIVASNVAGSAVSQATSAASAASSEGDGSNIGRIFCCHRSSFISILCYLRGISNRILCCGYWLISSELSKI